MKHFVDLEILSKMRKHEGIIGETMCFYLFLLSVKSDTSIAQLYIQAYYIMALMTQQ